jgi:hypothetical protein
MDDKMDNMKLGQTIYRLEEKGHAFSRKKIHMEIDGQDWFRYSKEIRTYRIVSFEVVGILKKELEGEWNPDEVYELVTQYCIRNNEENTLQIWNSSDFLHNNFSFSKDDVEEKKAEAESAARDMDKQ